MTCQGQKIKRVLFIQVYSNLMSRKIRQHLIKKQLLVSGFNEEKAIEISDHLISRN